MVFTRRTLISTTTGSLALSFLPIGLAHAAQMVDVRMWPAEEYTRVTLEHDQPIKFKYFLVRSPMPYRLVVDIEGLTLTSKLQKMISDVSPNDPYIKAVRIGQYSPTVVRLVMDLKSEVRPEVFSLKPVANYKYRLIFDIYPVEAEDPIAGVIAGVLLVAVYGGLCLVGAELSAPLAGASNGAVVITASATLHFGAVGTVVVAAIGEKTNNKAACALKEATGHCCGGGCRSRR